MKEKNLPEWASTMALVSNSGSLLGSNQGERIDEFAIVARFNNYSTETSYVADVGQKTDVWVTSLFVDINDPGRSFDAVFVPLPKQLEKRYQRQTLLQEAYASQIINVPLPTFERLLKLVPNPSTGLAMLWWLYAEFGPIDPSRVFGFDFFLGNGPHHYADNQTACLHDGKREGEVFKQIQKN